MIPNSDPPTVADPYRSVPPREPPKAADSRAVASMILGIVATVLCCLPAVGPVCGTIAIVLFAKFSGDYNRSRRQLEGRGMAIAGLVTGIIGCAIGALYTIYWLLVGAVFSNWLRLVS